MYPERLPADAWMRPDPAARGWARAIRRGPVTVDQALGRGLLSMLEEDRAEAEARNFRAVGPINPRLRRTLLGRLLHGRR